MPVHAVVMMESSMSVSTFFCQAEDGIRDATVTGVQTCALPIFHPRQFLAERPHVEVALNLADAGELLLRPGRSEERRVGKECRSPGSPKQYNTAQNVRTEPPRQRPSKTGTSGHTPSSIPTVRSR